MSEEQSNTNLPGPLDEARQLLEHRVWDAGRVLLIQGKRIAIFINPAASGDGGRLDVPVVVRALEGRTSDLEGATVVLREAGGGGRMYRERLNRHGLAVFRGVERGSYRPELTPHMSLVSAAHLRAGKTLAAIRRAVEGVSFIWQLGGAGEVALASDGSHGPDQTHTNADRSLTATVESDAGNVLLRLQSTDKRWEQAVVVFTYSPVTGAADMAAELIDVLRDHRADPAERIDAAGRLGGVGGEEAAAALRERLDDPDGDLRSAVESALAAIEVRTRFLTVLAWDETLFKSYVAEINLSKAFDGPEPKSYELTLPDGPVPPESLTPDLSEIIAKSIRCAHTDVHDLMAWRRLVENPDIHPKVRSLLEERTTVGD